MSRLQDLAQSILGYGKKSVDTYQKELPITQEITSRYTPQVALGAQLAGGEAQTPVRMASEFLKQRNLPGQSIVDALARYSENTPVKQASIKAYQGQPLTAQEQALLTENALQLVVGMNEPIKTGNKVQSLLKNKGILQTGTPEKQIQWMSDLAEAQQSLPAKVLKEIKSSTVPGSERTSAILQALEEVQTTPKVVKQALKIKRTDPLDALKVEARKYKSAEEFVNSKKKNTKVVGFDEIGDEARFDTASAIEDFMFDGRSGWDNRTLAGLLDSNKVEVSDVDPKVLKSMFGESRGTSDLAVQKYSQLSTEAPPVLIANGKFVDGGHRVEAAIKSGKKTIKVVDITEVLKDAEALGKEEGYDFVKSWQTIGDTKSQLTNLYNQSQLKNLQTTPKAIEQALKIKAGETIGDFQSRTQKAKGLGLLADYDKSISSGNIQEAQSIAQRIMNDPRYIKYHGDFQDKTGINLLQQLKTATDLGSKELQQIITDKIREQSVKGINAT